jgi:hypothetical protein
MSDDILTNANILCYNIIMNTLDTCTPHFIGLVDELRQSPANARLPRLVEAAKHYPRASLGLAAAALGEPIPQPDDLPSFYGKVPAYREEIEATES